MSETEENNGASPRQNTEQKETNLPEEFQKIINLIPQEKREEAERSLVGFFYRKSERFIGPMPPPHYLKQYDEVIPGGAERILAMAERQSNHRMGLEDFSIREEHRQSSKGQNLGFGIAVISLGLAFAASYFGHDAFAITIGSTTLVGLVGVFVYGKMEQKRSLDDKD